MKKINKVLLAGTLITGTSATGMIVNNNINNPESEVNSSQAKITTSALLAPATTHGTVTFGTVTSITDSPTGDVSITVTSYMPGTEELTLSENMAIVIYPKGTTDFSTLPLAEVSTTKTEMKIGTTLTISSSNLVAETEYDVYAAIETTTSSGIYDVLADTPTTFTHVAKTNATIDGVTANAKDATTYGGSDGEINGTITMAPNGSTITSVEVSRDGTNYISATLNSQTEATYSLTGLVANTYTVYVKVTTNLVEDVISSNTTATVEDGPKTDATITTPTITGTIGTNYGDKGSINVKTTLAVNDAIPTKIEYSLDNGGNYIDSGVTVFTDGEVNFDISGITQGDYTVTLKLITDVNQIGTITPASNSVIITDPTPIDPIMEALIASDVDTGSYGGTAEINVKTTIALGSSTTVESLRYEVKDTGTTTLVDSGDITPTTIVDFNTKGLPAGSYDITVYATTNLHSGEISQTTTTKVTQPLATDATITSLTATTTDASFGNDDGTITVTSTFDAHDATIIKIEFTVDGTTWVEATPSQTVAAYTFEGLPADTYSKINVRITTDISGTVILGTETSAVVTEVTAVQPTMTKPIVTSTDATGYGVSDGIIHVESTITPGDATISKVEYSLDGGTIRYDAGTKEANLNFNIEHLSAGSHTVDVYVTTSLNDINSTSDPITINQPSTDATIGTITAVGTNSDYSSDNGQIAMSATLQPNDATITKVEVTKDNGLNWEDAESGNNLAFAHTFTDLPEGTYNVNVKVTTNIGIITGTAVSTEITETAGVDATIGTIETIAMPSDYGLKNGQISLSATIDPKQSIISKVEVSLDGSTWITPSSNNSTSVSHTFQGVHPGTYNVNVRVTTDINLIGTIGTPTSTVVSENIAGAPNFVSITPEVKNGTHGDNNASIKFSGSYTDGSSVVTSVQLSKDGGTTWEEATTHDEINNTFTHEFLNLEAKTYPIKIKLVGHSGGPVETGGEIPVFLVKKEPKIGVKQYISNNHLYVSFNLLDSGQAIDDTSINIQLILNGVSQVHTTFDPIDIDLGDNELNSSLIIIQADYDLADGTGPQTLSITNSIGETEQGQIENVGSTVSMVQSTKTLLLVVLTLLMALPLIRNIKLNKKGDDLNE